MDDAPLAEAPKITRWKAAKIAEIREVSRIDWRRILLKCELRLAHFREHGAVPDGVTPSWLLERTLNQIAGVLAGLDGFYRSALRPAFGRPRYRRRAR